ncbi:hypothetical protein Isop_3348 [Isosphaera pallida ATCC 43644]|uniref:Uncharacterized protein n=1 Tax=Isosphaera pallida (strain ATCC 43644 / DSM 9630 / IS1B) TaxID=575540 RepID=E8R608_ISOPI|nr:hypothetical protein Isop_3348 [Isosphaera pallida ATCC 43644]
MVTNRPSPRHMAVGGFTLLVRLHSIALSITGETHATFSPSKIGVARFQLHFQTHSFVFFEKRFCFV